MAWDRYLSRDGRIRRALASRESLRICDLRPGLVKVVGRVRLIEPLIAPLSGRRAAAYECVVEEDQGGLRMAREAEGRDFLVEDGTGVARVELSRARISLLRERFWSSMDVSERRKSELLARHDLASTMSHRYCYHEGVLEEGEGVVVLGEAEREPDPTPGATSGYREAPMRWVIRAGKDGLLVSDDPNTQRD